MFLVYVHPLEEWGLSQQAGEPCRRDWSLGYHSSLNQPLFYPPRTLSPLKTLCRIFLGEVSTDASAQKLTTRKLQEKEKLENENLKSRSSWSLGQVLGTILPTAFPETISVLLLGLWGTSSPGAPLFAWYFPSNFGSLSIFKHVLKGP